ncbi:50S ribosomal protein L15 [Candidatus Peregrinibacteria bacterium]|nr:50S ribosomal protein L15 [Candidatus Peregrinibacteria bacterium]
MKLHDLQPAKGSKKKKNIRGRGDASGHGSFSGRGCKGQNSRTGGGVRLGFEGGQSSFLKKMPKLRGFTNPTRKEYAPVNLDAIEEKFENSTTITPETLIEKRLVRRNIKLVKILGRGEITKKLSFEKVLVSKAAKAKIEKAGGTISVP